MSMYRDCKGQTTAWVRERLQGSEGIVSFPEAWVPDFFRICKGASQVALLVSIHLHAKHRIGEEAGPNFTPIMVAEDFARETGFTNEQMRNAIKDAIKRRLIETSLRHRKAYRLCPENWPTIKNAYFSCGEPGSLGYRFGCAGLGHLPAEVVIEDRTVELRHLKAEGLQGVLDFMRSHGFADNVVREGRKLLRWMSPVGGDATVEDVMQKRASAGRGRSGSPSFG